MMKTIFSILLILCCAICVNAQGEDSWIEVDEFGATRYNLPKYRVQILDVKGKKYEKLKSLYFDTQKTMESFMEMNKMLNDEIILSLTPTIIELKNKNDQLIADYDRLVELHNEQLTISQNIGAELAQTKEKSKRFRRQRNLFAVATVAVVATIVYGYAR